MTAPSDDPTAGMEPIRQIAMEMEEERRKEIGTRWHVYSPASHLGSRRTLCGAVGEASYQYDGLDQAYRASVEGWPDCDPPCVACLEVAMIAMRKDRADGE